MSKRRRPQSPGHPLEHQRQPLSITAKLLLGAYVVISIAVLIPWAYWEGPLIAVWTAIGNLVALKILLESLQSGELHINATHIRHSEMGPRYWLLWWLNAILLVIVFANGGLLFQWALK